MFHVGAAAPMLAMLRRGRDLPHADALRADEALDLIERRRAAPSPTRRSRPSPQHAAPSSRFATTDLTPRAPRGRRRAAGVAAETQEQLPARAGVTLLRLDRARRRRGVHGPSRRPARAARSRLGDARSAASRSGSSTPRRDAELPPAETRRDRRPRAEPLRRLPQRPREDRGGARRDGWFYTGDLGIVDEDGRITFRGPPEGHAQGRRRERRRGRDRGVPRHPSRGRRSPRSSASPTRATSRCRRPSSSSCPARRADEAELLEFCRGRIASFKVPRYVRFVDDWPMSATKIQKFRLRDELVAELGLAGS